VKHKFCNWTEPYCWTGWKPKKEQKQKTESQTEKKLHDFYAITVAKESAKNDRN